MEKRYDMLVKENGHSGLCPGCGAQDVRYVQITMIEKNSGSVVPGLNSTGLMCCQACVRDWKYGPSRLVAHFGINQLEVEQHQI